MLMESQNDSLSMLQSNPEIEETIQKLMAETKKTTSMLVHELRNPLALIKGTIQYIEMKHPEAKEYKYWTQLPDLILDMEKMLTDASLLNSYHSLNKEKHNLIELFHSIHDSFMPQALNANIDLLLEVTPGCEAYYESHYCDYSKLKQVFNNLIKNAFEATSSGNYIKIILDYIPESNQSSSKLKIQVNDNGTPISEDDIESIFLPFVTYKKGGTGIGLAIVKKIIDLHLGSIHVTSNDELTSFSVELPF